LKVHLKTVDETWQIHHPDSIEDSGLKMMKLKEGFS